MSSFMGIGSLHIGGVVIRNASSVCSTFGDFRRRTGVGGGSCMVVLSSYHS